MAFTEALIQSFIKAYPTITKLSNRVQNNYNLITNYPLILKETSSHRYAIISQNKIRKGNDILMLSAHQCMFSTELKGSKPLQQSQIMEKLQGLSTQYQSMNADFMQRMKIYLQLLGNNTSLKQGSMPLQDYSEYALNSDVSNISKSDINSRFLMELHQSWEYSNKIIFGYLKKELLRRIEQQDFLNACDKGKAVIRRAGESSIYFAAPFLDKLYHSPTPNCQFDVLYFPHRKAPFIRIRAIRDIEAGQKPTISYGNLNNYELLIRYGFTIKDNPSSIFMLPLNFENIIEIFNKNIQWKQKQFIAHKMKLKNYVKILPNGDIGSQDLRMMRILINDNQNPSQKDSQSSNFDPLIYHFICDHANAIRKNIKINNLKISQNKFIQQLQDEEISILSKLISKNSK